METIKGYFKNLIFKSPEVLVIDHDDDNLALVSQTLEMFGYSCILTQDRQRALYLATVCQPGLILLEIRASDGGDLQVLRLLKENHLTAKIPILGLTTYASHEELEFLRQIGCVNYLCKPYLLEELSTLVTRYLPINSDNSSCWI